MDKKQIEAEIKAKKEAIKQANRELSKLQKELKKNEKTYFNIGVSCIVHSPYSDLFDVELKVATNKSMEEVKHILESLSDPVKPKSYIDWDKIPEGYNWVAIDEGMHVYAYMEKPYIMGSRWLAPGFYKPMGLLPDNDWRNSLTHRPGVKE